MARTVNKLQKKKDIAHACKNLLLEKGLNNLSISEVAKSANIGKSTVYDYFKNRDEIIFYIMDDFMSNHDSFQQEKIENLITTREKVKAFFNFFYEEEYREYREIYKDYISILLSNPTSKRIKFQTDVIKTYHTWLENLVAEAINKKELKPSSLKLVTGLFIMGDGLFITSATTTIMNDLEMLLNEHIDTLFDLIEIK